MSTPSLSEIYKTLGTYLAAGREDELKSYLATVLEHLPEETRNEIMLEMFIEDTKREALGRETIANLQEQGMAAAETLIEIKQDLTQEHSSQ